MPRWSVVIPAGVEIFLSRAPIDLRWSFDRLATLVEVELGREARGGALFVFLGTRRTALKILFHDGSGLCLFYKRLDKGLFKLPDLLDAAEPSATKLEMPPHVLDELLDGISVESAPLRNRRTTSRIH